MDAEESNGWGRYVIRFEVMANSAGNRDALHSQGHLDRGRSALWKRSMPSR